MGRVGGGWSEANGCPAVLGGVGRVRRRVVRGKRVSGSSRRCGPSYEFPTSEPNLNVIYSVEIQWQIVERKYCLFAWFKDRQHHRVAN